MHEPERRIQVVLIFLIQKKSRYLQPCKNLYLIIIKLFINASKNKTTEKR